jgi:hypothetical protein
VLWGLAMGQYFFAVRANSADTRERAAELKDGAAALAYALQMARELVPNSEGGSLVKVRDETRPIVFSIPFLPACA